MAEDNDSIELHPDDDPHQNEVSDLSDIEGPSDESVAEDEEFMGNRDASMHLSQSRPLTEKTIPYEEVYQMARDPQAKYKHWIVEQPSLAIKELGALVESCDLQKAEASNTEYDKALKQGYKPRNTMRKKKRARPNRPKSVTKKADVKCDQELGGSFEGVIDPVVGEVYHAWWENEPRSWYLVVILPYLGDGDWKEVGITGNLFTSGLKKEIPNCFKVVKVTTDSGKEALRLTWAEGYQDGGPKMAIALLLGAQEHKGVPLIHIDHKHHTQSEPKQRGVWSIEGRVLDISNREHTSAANDDETTER
ncbi:hypothetical protein SLS63_005470 [Diaporthe eres]|uniref:Uncharacterized protein n=1 Tax=Diaporthe eres TaxID=83184 RepID=A0ABR1PAV0_DIAER